MGISEKIILIDILMDGAKSIHKFMGVMKGIQHELDEKAKTEMHKEIIAILAANDNLLAKIKNHKTLKV